MRGSKVDAVVPAAVARRMLLGAQGLLDDPARAATPGELQRLIEQLGFVQIDSINVVERAHHLTLFSRLDGYRHEMLSELLERQRSLFEHWTHDASAIPMQWFAHWKHRFARYRKRVPQNRWWQAHIGENAERVVRQVMRRIKREGPLLSKDFEHNRNGQAGGWWEWKPQKAALEYLWRSGELAVAGRVNFQKVYDLTERVLPEHHALPRSAQREHRDWACRSALERLSFATPREITAFWHAITLDEARQWCAAALKRSEIEQVQIEPVDGSRPKPAFALRGWRERAEALPTEPPARIRLLCPFDPVLRDRQRTQQLFGFDYRFEAFVPAPKRRYGYYVLPILEGDQLIGRLDPKFHRDRGELEIKGLWWEPQVKVTKSRRRALEDAVQRLATFIGAKRIAMSS